MCYAKGSSAVLIIVGVSLIVNVAGHYLSRERRSGISDQRLAELETLLGLNKFKSQTQPIAYGLIDIDKIGKRKRSTKTIDVDNERFYPIQFGGGSLRSTWWNRYSDGLHRK